MENTYVRVVLFLVPGAFLIALGLRLYVEGAELSHVYGGFTIAAGILAALGGLLIALPRRHRAREQT